MVKPSARACLAVLVLACAAGVWSAFAFQTSTCSPSSLKKLHRQQIVMRASHGSGGMSVDRREQLERVAALAGIGLALAPSFPALADSTGKYSTKQTAKKRYLPRVRKGVKLFVDLGKSLGRPEAVAAFNQYVDDSMGTALALFGASTRIGELPDKGSRTVEAEVEDFIKACKSLGKAKDAAEAKATYKKAEEALAAFLKATKLEPLGDPIYSQQPQQ